MTNYAKPPDFEELIPDTGYAVVLMDEFKPPDNEDFINKISEFEEPEFELPPEEPGYTYLVHTADGETFTRSEWQSEGR